MRKKTKICLGCLREISLYDSVCPFCGFDPIKVKNPRYLRAGTRLLDRYLVGRELVRVALVLLMWMIRGRKDRWL
ncbi:MAG: hypothetical protein ACLTSD_09665 [Eubacterium sp.]